MRFCSFSFLLCSLPAFGTILARDSSRHPFAIAAKHDSVRASVLYESAAPSQWAPPALRNAVRKAKNELKKVNEKVGAYSPSEQLAGDKELLSRYYFPGKLPNFEKRSLEIFLVIFAFLWFAVYKTAFYGSDHEETLHASKLGEAMDAHDNEGKMVPDVVLVFPDPGSTLDKQKEVRVNAIKVALASKAFPLPRLKKLHLDNAGLTCSPRTFMRQLTAHVEEELSELSYFNVRTCLLQDLYENLARSGFDVSIFRSSEDEELYLCIKLASPGAIRSHLRRQSVRLQLRDDVITTELGIDVNADHHGSSPPFISYDSHLSGHILGKGHNDLDLYRSFAHFSSRTPLILSDRERIRIICAHLNSHIELDFAKREKLLNDWYPGHNHVLRRILEEAWGNWSLLLDFSLIQPVSFIQEYFGSRMSFMFAWNGFYGKLLLALTPVAFLFEFADLASATFLKPYWVEGSVAGFSLVVAMWGRIAGNWQLSDDTYAQVLWDVRKAKSLVHPHFTGEFQKSPVDGKHMELFYPYWKYALRKMLAATITLSFCVAVFMTVNVWLDVFAGKRPMVASMILSSAVFVFTLFFDWMSEALTLFENHKLVYDFYTSYLRKQFIFQFVCQYSPFFHIAVTAQNLAKGCHAGECTSYLRTMLMMTLPMLAMIRIAFALMSQFRIWLANRKQSKFGPEKFIEEQSKLELFGIREEVEHMTSLTLTLGHVLIFGGIAPIAVPLCFIVFAFQLRAAAVTLTKNSKRAFPYKTAGMGPWIEITNFLRVVGVLFSGYLLVAFGPLFSGTELMTRMSGLLFYFFFVRLSWLICDVAYPPQSEAAELLEARREYVTDVVLHRKEDSKCEEHNDTAPLAQLAGSTTPRSASQLAGSTPPREGDSHRRRGSDESESFDAMWKDFDKPEHYDIVIAGQWDLIPHHIRCEDATPRSERGKRDESFHKKHSRWG